MESKIETSFRNKVKLYRKRAEEIERYLTKNPHEWGKFQNEFNSEMNGIFYDIMNFEKIESAKGNAEKVEKLETFFRRKIRHLFVRGDYSKWTVDKPLGYAGDYKIMDDIYQNNPKTTGYARLFDNYYQMTSICVAVRNRKEDFKRFIIDFVNKNPRTAKRIMSLGSGSCREVKEIWLSDNLLNKDIVFDCYDKELEAIDYARELMGNSSKVNFIKQNILRCIAAKNINNLIDREYDLIYASGFFDYLASDIGIKLVRNLKKLLKPDGLLVISNMRDKYSNPTLHYMEWAGEWKLTYRTDDEFKKIFITAGFKPQDLKIQYEQQGIMQYILASKK